MRGKAHYIQLSEQVLLGHLGDTPIDLLLTHDAPRDPIYPGSGSLEIARVLQRQEPSYHFFGHYGGPSRFHLEANGVTRSYKLADFAGEHHGQPLDIGTIGLLYWRNRSEHAFELPGQR